MMIRPTTNRIRTSKSSQQIYLPKESYSEVRFFISPRRFELFNSKGNTPVYEPVSIMFRLGISKLIEINASNVLSISLYLHILNVLLSRELANEILQTYRPDASRRNVQICSWFAALMFGIHPLRTEVVAWASGQSYLLASLFAFLFVRAHVSDRRSLALALFILAVLCKAVSISVPILLVAMDVHNDLNRGHSNLFRSLLLSIRRHGRLFLICVITACAVMRQTSKKEGKSSSFPSTYDASVKFIFGTPFYVLKSILPTNLSLRYMIPDLFNEPMNFKGCVCLVMFVTATTMTIITLTRTTTSKKSERFALSWIAFLGLLSPTYLSNHCTMIAADRYSYLPAALLGAPFFACIFMDILSSSPHRFSSRLIIFVLCCCAMILYSHITGTLVDSFEIEENLWRRLLSINPDGDVGLYMNLGTHLMETNRIDEASQLYERAIFHYNITSPKLLKHYAASLTLREMNEDATSILRHHEEELSTPGVSLLISNLYASNNVVEFYEIFERHHDRLISSSESLDAICMACDILRRDRRFVEAEILCRQALSLVDHNSDIILEATSRLLLDQIHQTDPILSWQNPFPLGMNDFVIFDDLASFPESPSQHYHRQYYHHHHHHHHKTLSTTTTTTTSNIWQNQTREDIANIYLLSEMNIARNDGDVKRMATLSQDMLKLRIIKSSVLLYVREASEIGCDRAASSHDIMMSEQKKKSTRSGAQVAFTTAKWYTRAECLSSLGSVYADLKHYQEAAMYFDTSAKSFDIEDNNRSRSGAELFNAATMHGEMKNWEEARIRFQRSLELRPDLSVANCYLGSISYMLKERDRGLKDFKKCFDAANNNEDEISETFRIMHDLLEKNQYASVEI